MSSCNSIQSRFSEYLDGRLTGVEMHEIGSHLDGCRACSDEWVGMKQTQMTLASLGPVPEPDDLLLRVRVAVSHERARPQLIAVTGLGARRGILQHGLGNISTTNRVRKAFASGPATRRGQIVALAFSVHAASTGVTLTPVRNSNARRSYSSLGLRQCHPTPDSPDAALGSRRQPQALGVLIICLP